MADAEIPSNVLSFEDARRAVEHQAALVQSPKIELVDLVDLHYEDDANEPDGHVERVYLRCKFPPRDSGIAQLLEVPRKRALDESKRGLAALDTYLNGSAKICRLLRRWISRYGLTLMTPR